MASMHLLFIYVVSFSRVYFVWFSRFVLLTFFCLSASMRRQSFSLGNRKTICDEATNVGHCPFQTGRVYEMSLSPIL